MDQQTDNTPQPPYYSIEAAKIARLRKTVQTFIADAWKALPQEKRSAAEVEAEVLRLVTQGVAAFREDYAVYARPAAVERLTFYERINRARAAGFPNAGLPWSKDDDTELVRIAGAGASVEQLMTRFGRMRGAILKRLETHGLLDSDGLIKGVA